MSSLKGIEGEEGRASHPPPPHPFLKPASGQIFKDDGNSLPPPWIVPSWLRTPTPTTINLGLVKMYSAAFLFCSI